MRYKPNVRSDAPTHIQIDIITKELSFYHRNKLKKVYPIAVGKHNTPTPTGSYSVINKTVNPGGVFGTRWMGLSIPTGNYGIHGTNNNSSIGKNISLGCIRMYNRDVEEIYPLTPISTPVKIVAGQSTKLYHPGKNNYSGFFHTVKAGDTLWSIAKTYKVPMETIVQANKLSNPNILSPGQSLIIPR
ncbi:MAG TPA: L,D-transpeptidase family protein [Clostridia bacterium]|nr:L,D-transpeptidase family protein [Clostridia bacterium]